MYGYNPGAWSVEEDIRGHEAEDARVTRLASNRSSSGSSHWEPLFRYVEAYRRHGYKFANLNPVSQTEPVAGPELACDRYGLTPSEDVARLTEVRSHTLDV